MTDRWDHIEEEAERALKVRVDADTLRCRLKGKRQPQRAVTEDQAWAAAAVVVLAALAGLFVAWQFFVVSAALTIAFLLIRERIERVPPRPRVRIAIHPTSIELDKRRIPIARLRRIWVEKPSAGGKRLMIELVEPEEIIGIDASAHRSRHLLWLAEEMLPSLGAGTKLEREAIAEGAADLAGRVRNPEAEG